MRQNPKVRQIGRHVYDYLTADRFLGSKQEKKLAHNTIIYRGGDDSIGVRFHHTTIVRYYSDGRVQLDSGGYHTTTTKQRINQLLPGMMGLYQKKYDWFVENRYLGTTEPFEDGMTIQLGVPMRVNPAARSIGPRIGQLVREGYPDGHGQAGAIAYAEARRRGPMRSNPGKFSDSIEELLYAVQDQEMGSVDELGWYGMVSGMTKPEAVEAAHDNEIELDPEDMEGYDWPLNAIIREDSQGFITVSSFKNNRDMLNEWRDMEEEYERYYESMGEE